MFQYWSLVRQKFTLKPLGARNKTCLIIHALKEEFCVGIDNSAKTKKNGQGGMEINGR